MHDTIHVYLELSSKQVLPTRALALILSRYTGAKRSNKEKADQSGDSYVCICRLNVVIIARVTQGIDSFMVIEDIMMLSVHSFPKLISQCLFWNSTHKLGLDSKVYTYVFTQSWAEDGCEQARMDQSSNDRSYPHVSGEPLVLVFPLLVRIRRS